MPGILKALDDNKLAIAADDCAYESRSFAVDAPEDLDNGLQALAVQFSKQATMFSSTILPTRKIREMNMSAAL